MQNIPFCVLEKSRKIEIYKSKYKEWWLLLVDYLGINSMSTEDFSEWKQYSPVKGSFNKVLIIDPQTVKEIYIY